MGVKPPRKGKENRKGNREREGCTLLEVCKKKLTKEGRPPGKEGGSVKEGGRGSCYELGRRWGGRGQCIGCKDDKAIGQRRTSRPRKKMCEGEGRCQSSSPREKGIEFPRGWEGGEKLFRLLHHEEGTWGEDGLWELKRGGGIVVPGTWFNCNDWRKAQCWGVL